MNKVITQYKSLSFGHFHIKNIINANSILPIGVCIVIFFFWLLAYPQAMSYQEQYQLFLWTGDYFLSEMKVAGGLSQYIGEFIVQFYLIEWLGALLLGVVFAVITYLALKLMKGHVAPLSLLPAVLLLWHMGDENVMMAYPVSIILSLVSYISLRKVSFLWDIVVLPVMFWLIGPMVWLYAALRVSRWKNGCMLIYLVAVQLLVRNFILQQWPLDSVMFGIWYCRYEQTFPVLQFIIPIVILVLAKGLPCLSLKNNMIPDIAAFCVVVVLGVLAINQGYDRDKYELIRQDYLIRNQRWDEVISNAEKYTVQTPFWSESVNLSLAMTRQLSTRMFDFYQSGSDALIMTMYRDMTSNIPSMEAFYRLGMTNECMRYAFDLQESIPFGKKSGRFTQRIVECCIVSGKYDVARKHLALLKKSLFYRTWAKNTESFAGNESKINMHPLYSYMRDVKFKTDFLYYYPELAKIFYQLFVSNTDNKMALEYMLGQVLLEGNAKMFLGLVGAVNQFGGYTSMPYTYQDAINCIQCQGTQPGSPYGEYARQQKETMAEAEHMLNEQSAH